MDKLSKLESEYQRVCAALRIAEEFNDSRTMFYHLQRIDKLEGEIERERARAFQRAKLRQRLVGSAR